MPRHQVARIRRKIHMSVLYGTTGENEKGAFSGPPSNHSFGNQPRVLVNS